MSNCRICQNSVPRHQTFCSHCGARQTILFIYKRGSARRNIISRLKDYFREVFRSEIEKRFDAACELGRFGADAAIPDLEEIVNLEPENSRFREMLAVFYAGAGDERLSHPMGFPGGPIEELRSSFGGEMKAKEILSWVTKVRQLKRKQFRQYNKAYEGLDKALNGSLAISLISPTGSGLTRT